MSKTGAAPPPADVPHAIADIIDGPRTPGLSLSPDRRYLLFLESPPLPPIAELAQPELRLAGVRIHPHNNAASRGAYCTGLMLKSLAGGDETTVAGLPDNPRIQHVLWSPDSGRIAFALLADDHCELWSVDVATAAASRLADVRLNLAGGDPIDWLPDGSGLVCLCVLDGRGAAPQAPPNVQPVVQESSGKASPSRTFQDLLKNPHDEALFDYYFHSQLVFVTVQGDCTPLGPPRIYLHAMPSPDSRFLLVSSLHRPYSYIVPASRFPRRTEVWELQSQRTVMLADLPLAEDVPVALDAVRAGPRAFGWRADAPASVYWVEAGDGGDPATPADVRDRLFMWNELQVGRSSSLVQSIDPPETKLELRPTVLAELGMRLHGVAWGDGSLALVRESWWKTRRERMWRIMPDDPAAPPKLLWDRSTEDRYGDPGRPLLERNAAGLRVIMRSPAGNAVFLVGEGAGEEGNRPFLDRFDMTTGKAARLWQSAPPWYESPVTFLDAARTQLLFSREKVDEPTNYFVGSLDEPSTRPTPKGRGGQVAVTSFPHPSPELKHVQKEILRYRRADGVTCTATLYLPQGYVTADGPLPALLWAYPTEYKSAEHAAQLTRSPHRFIRVYPYSPLLWLTQGYAVLDGPTMPIVGEGDVEPNDTYVEQLILSAEAAVKTLVDRGVTSPGRVAVGGHSYGAFMTANLLAHTDLFAAGIGMSGSYNRTLTPFGFQSEERTLWQAPHIYERMSPFMQADKIKRPLLLIHGDADENVGTWPQQSERFFQALKGLGATARLVLLPHEGHGYQARETMYHIAQEVWQWLANHVGAGALPARS